MRSWERDRVKHVVCEDRTPERVVRYGQKEMPKREDASPSFDKAHEAPRDGKQPYATEIEDYAGEKIIPPRAKDKTKAERPQK